jgi:putative transposase
MPRAARAVLAGYPLHVVQRGINRDACFFAIVDYEAYLRDLARFAPRYGCTVHAYCLMTNHVHLLVTPDTIDSCSRLMKQVGQCHVQRINSRSRRTGTLWEGRFRSCLVTSDSYVLACYRYIELNPVRAGLVERPDAYRWSSFMANAKASPDFVKPHPAFEALSANLIARSEAYRALCLAALPERVLEEIRKATRVGCAIGTRRRGKGRPRLDEKNGVCPHF